MCSNLPSPTFVSERHPLRGSRRGHGSRRIETRPIAVMATLFSYDYECDATIDATVFIAGLTDDQLRDLDLHGWGRCGPADEIVYWAQDTGCADAQPVFDHNAAAGREDFDCQLDVAAVSDWISINRAHLIGELRLR